MCLKILPCQFICFGKILLIGLELYNGAVTVYRVFVIIYKQDDVMLVVNNISDFKCGVGAPKHG